MKRILTASTVLLLCASADVEAAPASSQNVKARQTVQAPAASDMNMVPVRKRGGTLNRNGFGHTLKLNADKTFLISAGAKLRNMSASPDPKLRIVVRFPLKNGKFDYKCGDFRTLKSDSVISLNFMYKSIPGAENVMVILSPRNLNAEDKVVFTNFSIIEAEDELE